MSNFPQIFLPLGDKNTYTQGDTFPEVLFEFDDLDPIDLTGCQINLDIYSHCSNKVQSFRVGQGLSILSSKSFKMDEIPENKTKFYPIGILKGDLEIINPEGLKQTYFEVIFKIRKQITQ